MSNVFRRTTTTSSSSTKTSEPPTPVNPYIVGSHAWSKFRSKGPLPKRITRNSIYTREKRERRNNTPTRSQIVKNSELIDKILNFTFQNEWMQIEGGENDGKWINTKHYGNKIFQSGKIYEYATAETHYFPIADTYDDPMGIALNYTNNSGDGSYCTISPNTWTTVVTRTAINKKKRAIRKEQEHIDNHDLSHKD
jgi:hypothetical protein